MKWAFPAYFPSVFCHLLEDSEAKVTAVSGPVEKTGRGKPL